LPVVITEDLARVIRSLLARAETGTPNSTGGPSGNPAGSSSPVDRMAVRMAAISGLAVQSCLREIGKIIRVEKPTTNANRADTALLALDNITALSSLPLLFTDRIEALDAAAIHVEYEGGDPANADALGVSLWHFSRGFVSAFETDEQRAKREQTNAKKIVPDELRRRRRPQKRPELTAA
jgi:hypothetical protein